MRRLPLQLAAALVVCALCVELTYAIAHLPSGGASLLELGGATVKKEPHRPKKGTSDPVNNPLFFPGKIYSKFFQAGEVHVRKGGFVRTVDRSKITDTFRAGSLKTREVVADGFGVSRISSLHPGRPITIMGNMQVDGSVRFASKATPEPLRFRETFTDRAIKEMKDSETRRQNDLRSRILKDQSDADEFRTAAAFIETLSVVSHTTKQDETHQQWRLVAHDDFHEHTDGWFWSDGAPVEANRSHCSNFDHFLEARGQSDIPLLSVSKSFDTSAPHTQLELSARVHMIDSWHGSVMFAQIDGEYVWLDTHDSDADAPDAALPAAAKAGINLCGGPAPHDRLSIPVKVIVPHNAPTASVSFGASALSAYGSFGIDDVSIMAH